jgi:hypothetical protein
MSEDCCGIRVGENVPDFKLETYEPSKGDFGEVSLEALKVNSLINQIKPLPLVVEK